MKLKALFLNCTLKKSPKTSNTEAFIKNASKIFEENDVETESIRIVDYEVSFGNTSDEGGGDSWPAILKKLKQRICSLLQLLFGEVTAVLWQK